MDVNVDLMEKKCNSDQWWNNDRSQYECKKLHVCKKDFKWNSYTYNCKNGKYLASIIDDSSITCDKIIELYNEETRFIQTNFIETNTTCKTQNFYILLTFLLINIGILISVSILVFTVI